MDAIILALVVMLGADDWRQREAAEAALAACGERAGPAIAAGCRDADPERRMRCCQLQDRLEEGRLRALLAAYQPLPWADSFRPEDAGGTPWAWWLYVTDHRCQNSEWPGYRQATEIMIRTMRQAGSTRAELRRVLEAMKARCDFWAKHHVYP